MSNQSGTLVPVFSRGLTEITLVLVLLLPVAFLPHQTPQVPDQNHATTSISTSEYCDPFIFWITSADPKIAITNFGLDRSVYRPGEMIAYSGRVEVSERWVYMNCLGQLKVEEREISPTRSSVEVQILDQRFTNQPSESGDFAGTASIPMTQESGGHTATATAQYHGASAQASAPFSVLAYTPVLSILYPSSEQAVYPGQAITVEGEGWIPNTEVTVQVNPEYTTTTDANGHFSLSIPVPEDQPLSEGTHTITATQSNLAVTASFTIRYRGLVVALDALGPVAQGESITISGNVTAQGTGLPVTGANVTIRFLDKQYYAVSNETGRFRTSPIEVEPSIKPGSYEVSATASRIGYRSSGAVERELTVVAAVSYAVPAAVAAGSAAGAAVALGKRIPQLKGKPDMPVSSTGGTPSIAPGSTDAQPYLTPGLEQGAPSIGPGQQPTVGLGHPQYSPSSRPSIQPGPAPLDRNTEFCIHCGMLIQRNSKFCEECGLRLR